MCFCWHKEMDFVIFYLKKSKIVSWLYIFHNFDHFGQYLWVTFRYLRFVLLIYTLTFAFQSLLGVDPYFCHLTNVVPFETFCMRWIFYRTMSVFSSDLMLRKNYEQPIFTSNCSDLSERKREELCIRGSFSIQKRVI